MSLNTTTSCERQQFVRCPAGFATYGLTMPIINVINYFYLLKVCLNEIPFHLISIKLEKKSKKLELV